MSAVLLVVAVAVGLGGVIVNGADVADLKSGA